MADRFYIGSSNIFFRSHVGFVILGGGEINYLVSTNRGGSLFARYLLLAETNYVFSVNHRGLINYV